jgi:heme/copper-type cytochrome/quinol oxidase subunit 2
MIQRVQTIFLFLIAVAMVVALTNPLWEKVGPISTEMAHLTALQYSQQQSVPQQAGLPAQQLPTTIVTSLWYLALLVALVALSSVYAIFQYRNRLTQTALCAVNALMLTAIMGIVLYRALYAGKEYGNPADQGNFLIGFYAIIAALVFNALANRFIRRDEKLVRGSDRLR